jgi:hypothetical protein
VTRKLSVSLCVFQSRSIVWFCEVWYYIRSIPYTDINVWLDVLEAHTQQSVPDNCAFYDLADLSFSSSNCLFVL